MWSSMRFMRTAELALPAEPKSASRARHFVTKQLSNWDLSHLEPIAALLLTELVTNAVIHAHTELVVRISVEDDVLRLFVMDGSTRLPRPRHNSVEATTGRGLRLVEGLSRGWGAELSDSGKTMWCELPLVMSDEEGEPDLDAFLSPEDMAPTTLPRQPNPPGSRAHVLSSGRAA